jgi:PadR family transcriptional regulator PadR
LEGKVRLNTNSTVDRKFSRELSSGITSLALLAVLAQADGPMYGYRIAKEMSGGNGDFQLIKQGALYPVLKSLEKSELLASLVEPSISGPPRRYYSITDSGRETLLRWLGLWENTCTLMKRITGGEINE